VTRQSAPHRVRLARAGGVQALGCAALVLLSACYDGDFFDRLVDPDILAAFRITTLTLIDPHFYSGAAVCDDSTNEYNEIWTAHLDAFEINPTMVLSPLDPAIETATKMQVVPATCIATEEAINCTDSEALPEDIIEATFSNSLQGGICGGPIMGSQNPKYMDEELYEQLSAPVSPCFLSALIPSLKLPLGPMLRLPLSNVQISATYSLEAVPQQLIHGIIVGFLPSEQGALTLGTLNGALLRPYDVIAGADSCQPDLANPIDDIDTVAMPRDGVWVYFNFTAERVAWSPASAPMVDPPTP
jgi:hypothetical protein